MHGFQDCAEVQSELERDGMVNWTLSSVQEAEVEFHPPVAVSGGRRLLIQESHLQFELIMLRFQTCRTRSHTAMATCSTWDEHKECLFAILITISYGVLPFLLLIVLPARRSEPVSPLLFESLPAALGSKHHLLPKLPWP